MAGKKTTTNEHATALGSSLSNDWGGAFVQVRQGTLTHNLSRISSSSTQIKTDNIAHYTELSVSKAEYSLRLPDNFPTSRMRDSLYNLFDILMERYTAAGAKDEPIAATIQEYMEECGLRDRKTARATIEEDLETLQIAVISFRETRRGKPTGAYFNLSLVEWQGVDRKGNIKVKFTPTAHGILKDYPVMPYAKRLRRIDGRRNPNSRAFLQKFLEHKRINIADPKRQDTLSVKTLLSVSKLPSYAEVMTSDKHTTQRIIAPFERDMDALEDTLTWEYCHRNGTPLTESELQNFDYDTFSKCLVTVEWIAYPDQTHLIEAKHEQRERAKRTRKKKQETTEQS